MSQVLVIRRFLSKSGQDVTHARVSGFAVSSLEINEQSQFLLGTTPRHEKSQRQDGELMVFSSAGFQNYTYNIYKPRVRLGVSNICLVGFIMSIVVPLQATA